MLQSLMKPGQRSLRAIVMSAIVAFFLFVIRFLYMRMKTTKTIKRNGSRSGDKKKRGGSHSSSDGSSSKHSSSRRKGKLHASLPTLYLLLGINGSGKSEWATQYVDRVRKSAIIVSADSIRAKVASSPVDCSRDEEVAAKMLQEIAALVKKKRTIIVDDCNLNLDPQFREKVLALAVEGEYNRVAKGFNLKPVFAATRIEKDIAEGKIRHVPTVLELEAQDARLSASLEHVKEEGWIEDASS